ncbi:MAG: FMN-binding negative transcriptional regulator [Rhizobiaceae bacterium]
MLYRPPRFETPYTEKDAAALARDLGFGTVISTLNGEICVSHLPLLIDIEDDRIKRIRGHMARANPHVGALQESPDATVIFNGPHAYVSAQWYTPGNPAAPSWNYVVVHVSGKVRFMPEDAAVSRIVDDLVIENEGKLPSQWNLAGYSPERRQKLLPHIIAFEIQADRVEPKYKLNQHYASADKIGAARGLKSLGIERASQIADLMLGTVKDGDGAGTGGLESDLGLSGTPHADGRK